MAIYSAAAFAALLLAPSTALSQTQVANPQAARQAQDAAGVDAPKEMDAGERAAPLASRSGQRLLSRNNAYNRQRAAEGRVGVRLGDDMSFAVNER